MQGLAFLLMLAVSLFGLVTGPCIMLYHRFGTQQQSSEDVPAFRLPAALQDPDFLVRLKTEPVRPLQALKGEGLALIAASEPNDISIRDGDEFEKKRKRAQLWESQEGLRREIERLTWVSWMTGYTCGSYDFRRRQIPLSNTSFAHFAGIGIFTQHGPLVDCQGSATSCANHYLQAENDLFAGGLFAGSGTLATLRGVSNIGEVVLVKGHPMLTHPAALFDSDEVAETFLNRYCVSRKKWGTDALWFIWRNGDAFHRPAIPDFNFKIYFRARLGGARGVASGLDAYGSQRFRSLQSILLDPMGLEMFAFATKEAMPIAQVKLE